MHFKYLVLIITLFLLPFSAYAQTTTEENATVGIRIDYPEDWASSTVEVSDGIQTLYLADSERTMRRILTSPTDPMASGRFAMIHYSPTFVSQAVDSLEELRGVYQSVDEDDWEETTINGELAYQWSYEDERTAGFVILYQLPDGRLNFSIADTAIGEMTAEMYDLFIEVIESIEFYSSLESVDDELKLSETAESDRLSFSFQYPEDWQLSEVEEVPTGVVISPTTSSTSLTEFFGGAWLLITDNSAELLGLDDEMTEQLDEMSLDILESYADAASRQGVEFTEIDLLEIDDIPVGRVSGEGANTIYMFVLNENVVQIWIGATTSEMLEALEAVVQAIIPTVESHMLGDESNLSLANFIVTEDDVDETYIMENGVAFDYPSEWSIIEENGLVLVSNLEDIASFTAQPDEILLIISTVSTEEQDIATTISLLQEVQELILDSDTFNIDLFRIDGNQKPTDMEFDLGDLGDDWNFSGGLVLSPDNSLNGAIFIIMSQEVYDPELATLVINPVLTTFRTAEED
ncbi:MAG: hypothetical protein AAF846_10795 [Chloroflexota bacterium]